MSEWAGKLNMKVKNTSSHLGFYSLKLFTGLIIGLTLSLIGQEILGYDQLSFTFITVVTIGIFMKISQTWRLPSVLIFDFICVLIALLLKMYIQSSLN